MIGESHIISRVETQMSDGSLHVSNSLSPEIAHLISQLSPDSLATCSASDVRILQFDSFQI